MILRAPNDFFWAKKQFGAKIESWSLFCVLVVDSQVLVGKQNVKEKEKKKHSQIKNPGFLEPVIPCVGKRTSKEFQTA